MSTGNMELIRDDVLECHARQEINDLSDRILRDMKELRERLSAERLPQLPTSYSADASLPWMWSGGDGFGGDRPDDPLTLYFWLSLKEDDAGGFVWATSLSNLVEEMLDDHIRPDGTVSPENFELCLAPIAEALMTEANSLMAYKPSPTT